MYCRNCENALKENAAFCGRCGKLNNTTSADNRKDEKEEY